MALPPETVVRPGHTDPTTVGEEWENNAFVRVWRGLDPEGDEPCTAFGDPATLVLLGDDYDGGHKAWVRWPDGRDDIVPGSQVQRGLTLALALAAPASAAPTVRWQVSGGGSCRGPRRWSCTATARPGSTTFAK